VSDSKRRLEIKASGLGSRGIDGFPYRKGAGSSSSCSGRECANKRATIIQSAVALYAVYELTDLFLLVADL
jgi:hypothetical protein